MGRAAPDIVAEDLAKTYLVAHKEPGLRATLRHFVRRRRRAIEAVRGVSFQVEPGEITGFLGPNGAGKTTTLKMLTGLIEPTGGRAEVLGFRPFGRKAALLRQITLVMGQKQQLLWDLPAWDSLRINAAIYDIPPAEARARVSELAEMLELGEELTQPVRKLSLGQRMKVELLAALLHRPRVLFLDEPTLGLDVTAQASVRDFLLRYNRRYEATILLTSHYMADIAALCRRVLVIHEGSLLHDGPIDALLERFSPHRELRLDLSRPVPAEALASYGTVKRVEGTHARIDVSREELTRAVSRALAELPVTDLEVREPALEDVIARIFRTGSAEPDRTGSAEPDRTGSAEPDRTGSAEPDGAAPTGPEAAA